MVCRDLKSLHANGDAWLANPQEIVPDAVTAYRQTRPETRAAIIACLRELN